MPPLPCHARRAPETGVRSSSPSHLVRNSPARRAGVGQELPAASQTPARSLRHRPRAPLQSPLQMPCTASVQGSTFFKDATGQLLPGRVPARGPGGRTLTLAGRACHRPAVPSSPVPPSPESAGFQQEMQVKHHGPGMCIIKTQKHRGLWGRDARLASPPPPLPTHRVVGGHIPGLPLCTDSAGTSSIRKRGCRPGVHALSRAGMLG